MQTIVKLDLIEFDSFSKAFKYAVDKTARSHSDFYTEIDMDKGQWSKIYTGETQNPQAPTRKKLTEVVGVEIEEKEGKWILNSQEEENENTTRTINHVNESLEAYEARKAERSPSDTEREILLEYLQDQAESLLKGLRQLADLDKKRS